MSQLSNKDLHTPFTSETAKKIKGHIHAMRHSQAAAADAAAQLMGVAHQDGTIRSLYFVTPVICGAGESMTLDVLVNGASILTGIYTINATNVPAASLKKQIALPLDPAKKNIVAGDIITVTRDYTAGGTPTPMTATVVGIEFA